MSARGVVSLPAQSFDSTSAAEAPHASGWHSPVPWTRTTQLALLALVLLWAVLFHSTWASWGDLTIDCGREVYVAAELARGQTLYRDVWYLYGPLSPYFNALLFHLFGPRLEVLYWAGSLSCLGSAIFLYLAGMRLSSWLCGWTAGAVVLVQAFNPGIFCFPLPYSFAAAYGCLISCLLLWLGMRWLQSGGWQWMFAAGLAAFAALALKLEFGVAGYGFLALLMAAHLWQSKSARLLLWDLLAVLPGVAGCVLMIYWMVSLRGVEFITQENLMSWPTNYFMRKYGEVWLKVSGGYLGWDTLLFDLWSLAIFASVVFLVRRSLGRSAAAQRWFFRLAVAFIALLATLVQLLPTFKSQGVENVFRAIFFPPAMVPIGLLGAAWLVWLEWRRKAPANGLMLAVLAAFSALLAARMWLNIYPLNYAIYYDGPAVLAFLLLVASLAESRRFNKLRMQWELALCLGCLTAAASMIVTHVPSTARWVPLTNSHGTIRAPRADATAYSAVVAFMTEQSEKGKYVLSVPYDTTLYFLSGTRCPARVYAFTPGILAPGRMTDEVIQEIESKPVEYLVWSNREFPEYGVRRFGEDYDQYFGSYLRAHYRPWRSLTEPGRGWSAVIWQRIPPVETR